MLIPLLAAGFAVAMPWDSPKPPPEGTQLILTEPGFPDPPPEGSVIDIPGEHELPRNWRSTGKADPKIKGHAGLNTLMASGSGQFCRNQFYAIQAALRGHRVAVIDLRQEPHVFLNGAAVAWGPPDLVGFDRSAHEVERVERAWMQHLDAGKFTTATQYAPGALADQSTWEPIELKIDIRDAVTEYQLVREARWGYFRIAAPDSVLPRDADIDRFIDLVRNLDGDIWLHFHCDTGGRRTSLYLTLYDMMRNYVNVPRPEIIARQRRLGGTNLLAGPDGAARGRFLARFFDYCWECGPLFRRNWSSWSRENPE
jgi:hypothetical protein